ncbi:hypothetical protein Y1Q_0023399 [Alligator mississippiensis]|uniref:Uncharacterized protein n=1 Tax=Alligator mississippiensis TaxID=8496 RepID=A0A151NQC2_ALLMI|nr:hypothetical protein Y1Q_0023399 [Alligator mississippiensis]
MATKLLLFWELWEAGPIHDPFSDCVVPAWPLADWPPRCQQQGLNRSSAATGGTPEVLSTFEIPASEAERRTGTDPPCLLHPNQGTGQQLPPVSYSRKQLLEIGVSIICENYATARKASLTYFLFHSYE